MPHKRGPWTNEEDARLRCSIQKHVGYHPGCGNWPVYYSRLASKELKWTEISNHVQSRNPKQCRERWSQNLDPTLDHSPLTPEEEIKVERLFRDNGPSWAKIARELGNRSDNLVKNHWNGKMNRYKRQESRSHTGTGHRRSASQAQYDSNQSQQRPLPSEPAHVAFDRQLQQLQYSNQLPPLQTQSHPQIIHRPVLAPPQQPSYGYSSVQDSRRPPALNLASTHSQLPRLGTSPLPSPTKQTGAITNTPWTPTYNYGDRRASLASHASSHSSSRSFHQSHTAVSSPNTESHPEQFPTPQTTTMSSPSSPYNGHAQKTLPALPAPALQPTPQQLPYYTAAQASSSSYFSQTAAYPPLGGSSPQFAAQRSPVLDPSFKLAPIRSDLPETGSPKSCMQVASLCS